jgi:N-carbamoyl-L-amino-acid hydrolase
VLTPAKAAAYLGEDGASVDAARTEMGLKGSLEDVPLSSDAYNAFVELHIEQGPILEAEELDMGSVTGGAARASLRVGFEGSGGHAGAVLMPQRRDALIGASRLAIAVEKFALDSPRPDTVATVGVLDVHPRAVNSIPSRVEMQIDVRDIHLDSRDTVVRQICEETNRISEERNLDLAIEVTNSDPPATCSADVIRAITESADEAGASSMKLVSRAYHDSLFMARVAPTGMIFIPCRGGVSHRPDEYSSPEQLEIGCQVLARTIAKLSLAD